MATSMTKSYGCYLELHGDLNYTLNPGYEKAGVVGFSDGSLFFYELDKFKTYHFKLIIKGSLFDRIEPGMISKGISETVHFKDGIKWAVATDTADGFIFKREKGAI